MVDMIMLYVPQVNKTTITGLGIGVNNATRLHLAMDNGFQVPSGAVRNDLRINPTR
jgi:hypothetical protein